MGIKMGHVGRAVSHKINHILRALSLGGTAQLRYVHIWVDSTLLFVASTSPMIDLFLI